MTNFEMLHKIFEELGIKHSAGQDEELDYFIRLDEGKGYLDFWCEFNFNREGKFTGHGVWEG